MTNKTHTSNGIELLYSDQHLLVVNKPPGLLCVPGLSTPDNLLDRLRIAYPNVRMVHRLDMATSGIVIFALNHPTQKALGKQFEHREIKKLYIAKVNGLVEQNQGEIDLPLICDWPMRPKQKVDHQNGKKALTRFRVLERCHEQLQTILELEPITGRSHQLRVHCLEMGHPIVGDQLYAPDLEASRLQLHAQRICFRHPDSLKLVELQCEVDFFNDKPTHTPV